MPRLPKVHYEVWVNSRNAGLGGKPFKIASFETRNRAVMTANKTYFTDVYQVKNGVRRKVY